MLTTSQHLHTLHVEACREHVRFEKQKNRRDARSNALSTTMAVVALATGTTAAANMPAAVTATLAALLLAATGAKLAVNNTALDRDLYRLAEAWRRHQRDASRLLARNELLARKEVQNPGDNPDRIHRDTVDLEREIEETRTWSLLFGHDTEPGPATPPTAGGNG
ncbi:MAG: hypothetical protein OXQ29_25035 [Rhodospirillaceae bacterium]|nr:hypothetical protein [Rhodospirillaceae bacterium]